MQVGDQIKVEFVDIDYEGRGVCKIDGTFPIFVPMCLKGERGLIEITELKKSYGFGKLIRSYEKSPFRKFPACQYYETCGGCNIMHLEYKAQCDFKTALVKDTLKRIANIKVPVNECVRMEDQFGYRNKLEFHFGFNNQKIRAGFYNEKSHQVVDINECLVEPKIATDIIIFLKSIFKIEGVPIYKERDGRGCIRHVIVRMNNRKEVMVVFVTNTNYLKKQEEIVQALIKKFPCVKSIAVSFQPANNSVHFGKSSEIIWGDEFLTEEVLGLKFNISPESFFQVNLKQTERLYQKVLDYAALKGTENVIDAYCGIGTISLILAKKAKHVYGIEIIEKAVENANKNKVVNGIENASFIYGPAEEKIKELVDNKDIDLLVVDPPRKGLDKDFIDSIGKMNINKLIYVSCNVRTLARDITYLKDYNYEVLEASPFDMFPNTCHVETVVLMSKKD